MVSGSVLIPVLLFRCRGASSSPVLGFWSLQNGTDWIASKVCVHADHYVGSSSVSALKVWYTSLQGQSFPQPHLRSLWLCPCRFLLKMSTRNTLDSLNSSVVGQQLSAPSLSHHSTPEVLSSYPGRSSGLLICINWLAEVLYAIYRSSYVRSGRLWIQASSLVYKLWHYMAILVFLLPHSVECMMASRQWSLSVSLFSVTDGSTWLPSSHQIRDQGRVVLFFSSAFTLRWLNFLRHVA